MKYRVNQRLFAVWLSILPIAISGCSSLVDKYDEVAYRNATSLKVDSLALMDKSTDSYATHEQSVGQLKVNIDKAYEYAKGRPNNEIVTKQWEIMKDPNRNLLGGFLARWKEKGTFSATFIAEAKGNVSRGFDQIIGLESGKTKPESYE